MSFPTHYVFSLILLRMGLFSFSKTNADQSLTLHI
nr:MAG TPA: hypothetical protein [Caudoviricetes sp.]